MNVVVEVIIEAKTRSEGKKGGSQEDKNGAVSHEDKNDEDSKCFAENKSFEGVEIVLKPEELGKEIKAKKAAARRNKQIASVVAYTAKIKADIDNGVIHLPDPGLSDQSNTLSELMVECQSPEDTGMSECPDEGEADMEPWPPQPRARSNTWPRRQFGQMSQVIVTRDTGQTSGVSQHQ